MPTQSQYCLLTPHRTMAERYHKIGSNNSTLVLPFLFPSVHSAFETISVSLGNDSPVVEFERHRKMGHQLASGWHRLKWRSQRPKPLLRRHTVTVRYLPLYQILPLVWPSSCARRPPSDSAQPLDSRPVCLTSPLGTAAARARLRRTSLPLPCVSDGGFVSTRCGHSGLFPRVRAQFSSSLTICSGFTRARSTVKPQCRCGPVTRPVAPTLPSTAPASKSSPTFTSISERCP